MKLLYNWPMHLFVQTVAYVSAAALGYFVFYVWQKNIVSHLKIQSAFPKRKIIQQEMIYSAITILLFSAVTFGTFVLDKKGYTRLYWDISHYGKFYFPVSIILMVLLHDAYFYWTHRLIHQKKLFATIHHTHHRSVNPSPWAAFSFHPVEALLHIGIVPLIAFTIPAHPVAVLMFLVIMTWVNVFGHLGYEFYPRNFIRQRAGRWLNTPTHHNMHHQFSKNNFGLYFNWWDSWMGTNHLNYPSTFEKVKDKAQKRTTA